MRGYVYVYALHDDRQTVLNSQILPAIYGVQNITSRISRLSLSFF